MEWGTPLEDFHSRAVDWLLLIVVSALIYGAVKIIVKCLATCEPNTCTPDSKSSERNTSKRNRKPTPFPTQIHDVGVARTAVVGFKLDSDQHPLPKPSDDAAVLLRRGLEDLLIEVRKEHQLMETARHVVETALEGIDGQALTEAECRTLDQTISVNKNTRTYGYKANKIVLEMLVDLLSKSDSELSKCGEKFQNDYVLSAETDSSKLKQQSRAKVCFELPNIRVSDCT